MTAPQPLGSVSDELPKARNPAWAAILSLMVPGLGQVYNGRLQLGIGCWLLWLGLNLGSPFFWAPLLALGFWAVAGAYLFLPLVRLAIVLQAGFDARRCRGNRRCSWWLYLVMAGFPVAFHLLLGSAWLAAIPIHTLQTSSGGMVPTLYPGDCVIADYRAFTPTNGDIIIYDYEGASYIKRVAAVGGQRIEIRDSKLLVDDQVVPTVWEEPSYMDYPESLVPPGHYFVLGDNINNSRDSRFLDPVPGDKVLGRVVYRYFGTEIGTRL
ncbi:MAG: signal peptidase I [Vulcanimicrobiota bacterium]